jgi:hydroxypyruvate isomerase
MRRDRRQFLHSAVLSAAAAAAWPLARLGAQTKPARSFRLAYAPHFGMFQQHAGPELKGEASFIAQLEFMASEGFTALEDNGMREKPVELQERIGQTLARLNMRMGVFVAHEINWKAPTLTTGDAKAREKFLAEVKGSIDVAKRVNAKWMTVVPGYVDPKLHMDFQTAHVVQTLRQACALIEPHGLTMVLEPLNTLTNHPGMFLTTTPQTYLICKAVNSPSCKILFDMYHQQITEGNLIPNINATWDEIAYFQVGDNPGRNEPGTGEVNWRNVFKHIHGKGFKGVVGMEHGNSQRGRQGERAVIDAYVAADAWT